jgi:hypothetical protein
MGSSASLVDAQHLVLSEQELARTLVRCYGEENALEIIHTVLLDYSQEPVKHEQVKQAIEQMGDEDDEDSS